ncbi:MAG: hypothetical protein II272_08345 [Oscillospiraceae bacterium]|nr:hypothetical protein [Oscillospiraceae bacterium]
MKFTQDIDHMDERMRPFAVRATAKSVRKRNVMLKLGIIILLIIILLLGAFYALSVFVNKAGNFTVWIQDGDMNLITLSDTPDFEKCSTMLEADIIPQMDNITKSWMPDNLTEIDGCHNGENYIAYTFYLKNAGINEIDYSSQIDIQAVTLGADHAVRVMVIKNGEERVYAKAQKDSTEPEPDTEPFLSNTVVMSDVTESFEPGEFDKYTVVIWLEGEDPECIDNIRGGVVKMSMHFKVLETD